MTNLPAVSITFVAAGLLILGIQSSATLNAILGLIKLVTLLIFVAMGMCMLVLRLRFGCLLLPAGGLACIYLLSNLPHAPHPSFLTWNVIMGVVVCLTCARRNSRLMKANAVA